MFDFPASPIENQTFSPPGGPTYVYKSSRWLAVNLASGAVPEAPNNGIAYVRQSLAWVIGYTAAAIDTLLAGKATQSDINTAVATREPTITGGSTAQYWRGDKSWQTLDKAAVGLANVDNTSDANAPVSTAQAAADALRVLKAGDTMTGDLTITKAAPALDLRKTVGNESIVSFRTGTNLRWGIRSDNTAEGGANAGGNLLITRYDDAGVRLNDPLVFTRDTGRITFNTGSSGVVSNGSGNWSFGNKVLMSFATAIPAGGSTNVCYTGTSVSNFGVFFGSGAPTVSAAQGSIYLRSDGAAGTRSYVNSNGTTGWAAIADAAYVDAADALKAPLASPVFTGDPQAPTPATSDNDTSLATTAYVKANIALLPGAQAQAKNRIVNPAMQISQELAKTGSVVATNGFVADQWNTYWLTTGSPAQSLRQDVVPSSTEVDWYFRFSSSVADTSLATSEYCTASTKLEGTRIADFKWGKPIALPAVFRIMARSSIAGTFCVRISSAAGDASFTQNCTITTPNQWTLFTFPVPACTIGTWPIDTSASLIINITNAAGASLNTATAGVWSATPMLSTSLQTNWLASTANTLEFTNVGLHLDPQATGIAPPWVMPDEAQELAACKRYWSRIFSGFSGNVPATGQVYYAMTSLEVCPRIVPALTGTHNYAVGFAAAPGTLTANGFTYSFVNVTEARTSNATSPAGVFNGYVIANARM